MSDWRDVMEARRDADNVASTAVAAPRDDTGAIMLAILALRLEVRALSVLIDLARGDTR